MTAPDSEWFQGWFAHLLANIEKVVKGKRDEVAFALSCLFAEGHLLLEDKPGTGKTTLAKAIAASIEGSMSRIQFTPDLLPSDVTGGMIFNQASGEFQTHRGPVFANIVLADEINRASPKTQASMLEVMEERQVTVGGETNPVPKPFMVIATQNPVEQEGTYRLPEAQLDRFLMRMTLGYPSAQSTVDIMKSNEQEMRAEDLEPVISNDDVLGMVEAAKAVHMEEAIYDYIVRLVEETRRLPEVSLGSSPRGAISLMRAAKSVAAAQGKNWVEPDDIKRIAPAVLAHRMILTPTAEMRRQVTTTSLVEDLLDAVPLPSLTRS